MAIPSAMSSNQADDHKFKVSLGYIVRHWEDSKGRKEKKEGIIIGPNQITQGVSLVLYTNMILFSSSSARECQVTSSGEYNRDKSVGDECSQRKKIRIIFFCNFSFKLRLVFSGGIDRGSYTTTQPLIQINLYFSF